MSIRPAAPATTLSAHKTVGSVAEHVREHILAMLEVAGETGLIGDEVRAAFPDTVKDGSINTRFSELERAGLIVRNGDTRPGASGRQQLVLRLARFGTPSARKVRKTAFLAGLMYGAKLLARADSLENARQQMKHALIDTSKRLSGPSKTEP